MILLLWVILMLAASALAQEGQPVQVSPQAYQRPVAVLQYYDGSNRLEYLCRCYSQTTRTTFTVSSATNAATAVFTTATAHGLFVTSWNNRVKVTVSGGTGNWAAANSTWILVPVSGTTFSLYYPSNGAALDSSGFGALTGTIVISTDAPRTNQNYWHVLKLSYDGSGNTIGVLNGFDAVLGYGRAKCDDRATVGLLEYK